MVEQKQVTLPNFKVFNKYDLSEIQIEDPGLKTAISLRKQILFCFIHIFN